LKLELLEILAIDLRTEGKYFYNGGNFADEIRKTGKAVDI